MTNPIAKHTSNLFASRGLDFDAAIAYAKEVIEAMPNETRASAYTALMVVVNTAANVWTQSQGPSLEKLAIIELIDARIAEKAADIDQQIADWMDSNMDYNDLIREWMSDNFDVSDYNVDDVVSNKISEWASDNLADEVSESIKQLTFRVTVD